MINIQILDTECAIKSSAMLNKKCATAACKKANIMLVFISGNLFHKSFACVIGQLRYFMTLLNLMYLEEKNRISDFLNEKVITFSSN